MTKGRDYKLDWLRVIAITMIVIIHSPHPDSPESWTFIISSISYFMAPCICLFFMISGALLLDRNETTKEFLKRRFTKIMFPTIFWSLFYLIERLYFTSFTLEELFKSMMSIPFSAQGHGILWFMYTLAGLYLLTPVLSRWVKSATKHEVEFYLLLWGLTLVYPYLNIIFDIDETKSGILYYFSGYVGYYVFGYYLSKYYKQIDYKHIIIAMLLAIAFPVVIYAIKIEFDFYSMLWYLSLPVALMAFSWYTLIYRLSLKRSKIIEQLSGLSFGIYLVHVFIMSRLVWHLSFVTALPGLLQIFTISIITFLLSYLVVWLITKLPYSKYIIGI